MLPAGSTANTFLGFSLKRLTDFNLLPCCRHGSGVSCQRFYPGDESSVVEDSQTGLQTKNLKTGDHSLDQCLSAAVCPVFLDRRQIKAWNHWHSLLSKPDKHELNIFTLLFTSLESVPLNQTLNSSQTICHPVYWYFDWFLSGHLDVMPVCVLSEGAGTGTQIPTHLTQTPISLISTSTDYSNKTVKVCLQQAVIREAFHFYTKQKDRNFIDTLLY